VLSNPIDYLILKKTANSLPSPLSFSYVDVGIVGSGFLFLLLSPVLQPATENKREKSCCWHGLHWMGDVWCCWLQNCTHTSIMVPAAFRCWVSTFFLDALYPSRWNHPKRNQKNCWLPIPCPCAALEMQARERKKMERERAALEMQMQTRERERERSLWKKEKKVRWNRMKMETEEKKRFYEKKKSNSKKYYFKEYRKI
jgi:hypothetical protein